MPQGHTYNIMKPFTFGQCQEVSYDTWFITLKKKGTSSLVDTTSQQILEIKIQCSNSLIKTIMLENRGENKDLTYSWVLLGHPVT